MTEENTILNVEQKDSIKVIKNTKGYFWEIKVVERDGRDLVKEIKNIDEKLRKDYPEVNK